VRPIDFEFNEQTAKDNEFQNRPKRDKEQVLVDANEEFQRSVDILKDSGVEVFILESSVSIKTPDSVFPNNWFSVIFIN
jgi:hypothetical protein